VKVHTNHRSIIPLAFVFPFVILILDTIFRGRDLLQWKFTHWVIYIFSFMIAGALWLLVFRFSHFLFRYNRVLISLFVFLIFLSEICFLIISYGFYEYFRGIPNYFVGEFIVQEPKDFYSSVTGTVTFLHLGILILFTFGLSILWLQLVKRYNTIVFSARSAMVALLISLFGSYGLTQVSPNYDQAILPDLNALIVLNKLFINEVVLKEKVVRSGLHRSERFELPRREATRPVNILIILNESMRRRSLKPFGYKTDTTPFITNFIENHREEVFIFKRAYANSTFTMLSVPSLMTGVSPVSPGKTLHKMPLLFDYGKMIDYYTFFISSQTFEWRNIGNFFEGAQIDYFWNKEIGNAPVIHDIGTDDRLIVTEWLKTLQKIGDKPFLGVLQTYANHYPYFSRKRAADLLTRYHYSITYVDSISAEIFNILDKKQLLENTVIIFTSDHGEAFQEHGYYGHIRTYYEEESGIPLWIYIPKKIQKYFAEKISDLRQNTLKNVSNLDLVPTIIDILNIKNLPEPIPGNLLGSNLLEPIDNTRSIYLLNNNEVSNYRIFLSVGLLKEDYKYLFIKDGNGFREALYNLADDPEEKNNLIKKYPGKVEAIYRELNNFDAPRKIFESVKKGKRIDFYD
jgi:glucan phosphoethanolaminetransferase (alkaline phosphatase superfamily)